MSDPWPYKATTKSLWVLWIWNYIQTLTLGVSESEVTGRAGFVPKCCPSGITWTQTNNCFLLCSTVHSLGTWLGTVRGWRKDWDTEGTADDVNTRKSWGQAESVLSDEVAPTTAKPTRNLSIFIMDCTVGGVSLHSSLRLYPLWGRKLQFLLFAHVAQSFISTGNWTKERLWRSEPDAYRESFALFQWFWDSLGPWPAWVHLDNNILSVFHPFCTSIQDFPGTPQSPKL